MNKVVLIGRTTKDPELKYTPGAGTAVTTLTLAVDRKYKKDGQQEADFIPVVIWGKQAEATAQYVAKGKKVSVAGRIQTRSYDAKDGTKRYVTEIVAEEVEFIEFADRQGGGQAAHNQNQGGYNQNQGGYNQNQSGYNQNQGGVYNNTTDNFDQFSDMMPVDEGDIPF